MQKINTILFDLDGTLVDSNELIIYSFGETMIKYVPNKNFSRKDLVEMIGPPLYETFEFFNKDPKIVQDMIDYYLHVYRKNEFDFIKLYPNTLEMLKGFYDRGFNLGIVTTKFKESAIPSIEHYGLDKYITSFCFLDNVKNHKPDPEPIEFALSNFENVENVVMVGDNTGDILAGFNAGYLSCGIEWSIKKDLIKELNPTFWIKDYSELIGVIDRYNKEV